MKKKIKTVEDFIKKSLGEWKSIRSTHTLAFQEYENTVGNISIAETSIKDKIVEDLYQKFNLGTLPLFALSVNWKATSDWTVENKNMIGDRTLLIFLPNDLNSGIILRNKGYTEAIPCQSNYFIDKEGILNLTTEYNSTNCEERIKFLSENVRIRYSIIKSKINNSIMQTSHSSEIKKIAN